MDALRDKDGYYIYWDKDSKRFVVLSPLMLHQEIWAWHKEHGYARDPTINELYPGTNFATQQLVEHVQWMKKRNKRQRQDDLTTMDLYDGNTHTKNRTYTHKLGLS